MKYPLTAEIDVGQIRDTLRVLKSRNTVRYLIEIVLPLFAANIFMSYLVPLEIDGFGYSSVMISALLLGAYLIAAYAGPAVTGFVTKMMRPGTASYVYCLGVAVLLTVYGIWKTFGVLVVVVLLLGFMDSFGPSVMTGAYTELNNKDGIRSSGSILVYMIATRIGMTIAPTMLVVSGTPFVLPFCIFAGVILYAVSSYWIRRKEVLLRDE
jgi:predicted MFS family arabinose efflux permease